MSSERFGGRISINPSGRRSPFDVEFEATMQAYVAYGFEPKRDMTKSALLAGVGGAFMTSEMPPAEFIPDVGPSTQQYFGRTVRPQLAAAAERGDKKALQLAHQVGRFVSANALKNPDAITGAALFNMDDGVVTVDGLTQPYEIEQGNVLDCGMGVTGLFLHLHNMRANKYNVVALQKTQGEKAALEGLAAHRKLTSDQLQIFAGGIKTNSEGLVENSGPGVIDLIVASRIHEAGADLEAGVRLASTLLHSSGLLVARGPRRFSKGTDYDKLHRIVSGDPALSIVANTQYARTGPRGQREDNRAFIARAS